MSEMQLLLPTEVLATYHPRLKFLVRQRIEFIHETSEVL